jgi:hypothetical protein
MIRSTVVAIFSNMPAIIVGHASVNTALPVDMFSRLLVEPETCPDTDSFDFECNSDI